jgi:hypothetical protein
VSALEGLNVDRLDFEWTRTKIPRLARAEAWVMPAPEDDWDLLVMATYSPQHGGRIRAGEPVRAIGSRAAAMSIILPPLEAGFDAVARWSHEWLASPAPILVPVNLSLEPNPTKTTRRPRPRIALRLRDSQQPYGPTVVIGRDGNSRTRTPKSLPAEYRDLPLLELRDHLLYIIGYT